MRGLGLVAPWACALALVSLALEARAGDTSGGSSSGSETTSDSSSEDESNDDEFCGDDCSGSGAITIVGPGDGAVVLPTFTVTLEASDDCYCDTCGCFPEAAESISLALDGASVGSCEASPCMIEVVADPGEHTLRARAVWFFSEDEMTITIHVEGDDATDSGPATEGGDEAETQSSAEETTPNADGSESSDSTAGVGSDEKGCSCRAEPTGSGAWALALLAAFARPRRRRC